MSWKLEDLLSGLHEEVQHRLSIARKAFGHETTKGDATEAVWLQMLESYLPQRYKAAKATVVDSEGSFSDQIDVVIFDRQYTPFIFNFQGGVVVPAESVYAAFESKQTINASHVAYAQDKIASVRRLHRTSLPVPHAGGTYDPKVPQHILGGLLTFESDWIPPLGESLSKALAANLDDGKLDLGCVAAHGVFGCDATNCYSFSPHGKPATSFLLELIARLQESATVPMIDIRAYAKWLG
jgi:hypothetical protein